MRMILASLAMLAGGAVSAETVTYDCQMGGGRGPGWVMNAYSFTVDKSALTVAVYDPMIKQFIGHPVVTDLDLRSNGNMIFRWELKNVPTSTGGVRVVYDAFINARTGSNWVEATIPSSPFFVGPRRTGRCGAR